MPIFSKDGQVLDKRKRNSNHSVGVGVGWNFIL
jgi:hypothetical protein